MSFRLNKGGGKGGKGNPVKLVGSELRVRGEGDVLAQEFRAGDRHSDDWEVFLHGRVNYRSRVTHKKDLAVWQGPSA